MSEIFFIIASSKYNAKKLYAMSRKITLLLTAILLVVSKISFCQIDNPYADFDPKTLKENAKYARSFAPNTYDERILYSCMADVVNAARAQYAFLPVFKSDERMDSTAMFQASYQAQKDEKTLDNFAPYKTTYFRLRKYGLAGNGNELVTKVKAYLGEAEYSYYDLCLAAVQSILKSPKTAEVLLDKQYSYLGIGFNTDAMMKSMYISFVFGNDRTFNNYKPSYGERDLPYTKGLAGFKSYDDKVCKKCSTDPALEVLSELISVNKNNEVYLNTDDYKNLKKLIGKEGDAIALDFVQHSQYECDDFTVDYDLSHRGTVTKPITFEKIMELNENSNLKSGKLTAKLCDVPETVNNDFDINILVLKEGNRICRTVITKAVETKKAENVEKVNFIKDLASIKAKGEWTAAPEDGEFSVTFPYDLKKTDYTTDAFESQLGTSDVPEHKINSIEIIAHNSPNYYKDAAYQKIQEKRVDFLKKSILAKYPGTEVTVSYDYCWESFKKNIVNDGEYYDLSFLTLEACAKQLKAESWTVKYLDSAYLAPCRYYEIKYHVTYKVDSKAQEQTFAVWKFNKALSEKNRPLAMSIENYIIDQVESGQYTSTPLNNMVIPNHKDNQALLNNRLYMKYYLAPKLTEAISDEMTEIFNLNPTNVKLLYNTTVCDVFQRKITSTADIAKTQANIDKLYSIPGIPKDRVNAINMEYQMMIIDYLSTVPANMETTALMTSTFAKIKEIRNPVMDSWQNAYKLAARFASQRDYMYALSLMDPFLDDATISEDFLFSYISMAAHREQTYLGPLFGKAVKLAAEKNAVRLCGLFDELPVCVFENEEAKAIVCKACNR